MKITVYTTSGCQFSKQEKDYLASRNLPYEEKNLEANREFLTEMLAVSNNFSGTPVTKIEKDDGQISVLKGFTKEEFDQVLATSPAPGPTVTEPVAPPVVEPPPVVSETPPIAPVEPVIEPVVTEPQLPPTPEPPPTPAPTTEPNPLQNILSDLETKASQPVAETPPTPPPTTNPTGPTLPPTPPPTPTPPTIPDLQA